MPTYSPFSKNACDQLQMFTGSPVATILARTLVTDITATTASPIANVLIIFILRFVCSLFLTLAESDFWLDVQATTHSFTRLSYCCLLLNLLLFIVKPFFYYGT